MNTPIINIKILEIHIKTNINQKDDISSLIKGGDNENKDEEDTLLKIWKSTPSEFSESKFSLNMIHGGKKTPIKKAGLQKYPFITDTLKYPYDDLKGRELQYILEFFFNRGKFSSILKGELDKNKTIKDELRLMKTKTQEEQNKYKQDVLETNVMTMLRLLFPTSYPIMNNIRDSYSILTNKPESLEYISKFSYINMNSKIYTITNVVWLNDIMNHPMYHQLIVEIFKYITWGLNQRDIIEEEDKVNLEKNEKLLKSFDAEPVIGKIDNAIADYEQRGKNYYATEIRAHKTLKSVLETKNDLDMTVIIQKHIYKVPYQIGTKTYWFLAERTGNLKNNSYHNSFVTTKKNDGSDVPLFFAKNTDVTSVESINWNKTNVIITLRPRLDSLQLGANKVIEEIDKGKSNSHFYGKVSKSNNGFLFTLNEGQDSENFKKLADNLKTEGITIKSDKSIEFEKTTFRKRAILENDENVEKQKTEKIFYKISSILEANSAIDRKFSEPLYTEWIRSLDTYYQSMIYINRFREEYLKCYNPNMSNAECIKMFVGDKTDWSKTQFKEIMKPINGFKNYMSKLLKSQNSKLQTVIDNFGNNVDDDGIFNQLVVRLYQKYIENSNIYLNMENRIELNDYLNTSLSSMNFGDVSKPDYLMFLHLDLVEGEIDNTNIDKMKCMYGDKDLQKRLLDDILNYFNKQPWQLKSLPFFSIVDIPNQDEKKKDIPTPQQQQTNVSQPKVLGGKHRTIKVKKIRQKYRRTRKHH